MASRIVIFFFSLLASFSVFGDSFAQRLTPQLAISGARCLGGETDAGFKCRSGEWLIFVDTINRCSDGWCTELAVDPITAKLRRRSNPSPDAEEFKMIPSMPVRAEVRWILRNYVLQRDFSGHLSLRGLR